MEIKNFIEEEKHDDVVNEVNRLLQEEISPQNREVLKFTKLIALIKDKKLDRATDFIKNNLDFLKNQEKLRLCENYILYKKGKLQILQSRLKNIQASEKDVSLKLLEAQTLGKLEKYKEALFIYSDLQNEKKIEELELKEELRINILNTIILLALSVKKDTLTKELMDKMKILLVNVVEDFSSCELRESFINYVLILIVLDKTKIFSIPEIFGENFDLVQNGEQMIEKIEQDIKNQNKIEDEQNEMIIEDEEKLENNSPLLKLKGEKLIDYLTLFILRTFFMQKRQQINWQKSEVEHLQKLILDPQNMIKDQHLRISLLSYLILLNTLNPEPVTDNKILINKIEEELLSMQKSKKMFKSLEYQLYLNQIILLLHMKNFSGAKRILKQKLKYNSNEFDLEYLPIELTIFAKSKNYKEFEKKLTQIEASSQKNNQSKCIYYLFQLSFYFNINNQKNYTKAFTNFLNNFFIPQINKSPKERFLKPEVFTQFAQTIVFYILKNNQILNNLREKIVEFVEYIQDEKSMARIAEGFVEKKELNVAQKIYEVLVKKNTGNMLFNSRLNYIYSILSPEKINDALLPEFDIIKDFNTLSNVENEYLKYIKTNSNIKNLVEKKVEDKKSKKKVKKIKKRIRWPKNFDFENPGPRPHPERWVPKFEREKYRKMALKKGNLTRTQGISVSSSQQTKKTKELFKQTHSTANQKTKKRKNKKKGRK